MQWKGLKIIWRWEGDLSASFETTELYFLFTAVDILRAVKVIAFKFVCNGASLD